MKRSLIALATVLTAALCAALPLTWRADWPDAKPVETLVHRGTDVELQPTWYINGQEANPSNWTFTTYCQTNAVGPWFGPLPGAAFSHTNDVGAAFYNVMVRAQTPGGQVNYTAFARLRMLDSPGFAPGELPLPVPFIDFSKVVALHAPWTLQTDFDAAISTLSDSISTLNDTKASKADATLTDAAAWACNPASDSNGHSYHVEWQDRGWATAWFLFAGDSQTPVSTSFSTDASATRIEFSVSSGSVVATRAASQGYQLGTQEYKPLASEAEAAANRAAISTINSKIPSAASASNQLADKAWTDDAIDSLAAYYITYTAAGAAFPTRAALTNATVVYSGGVARTPTRNDYAVVLADESHSGAEWRYIYTVAAGATSGQWDAQYPIETNDYDALSNKPQINGHTLSGNQTGAALGVLDLTGGSMTGPLTIIRDNENIKIDGSTIRFNDDDGEAIGGTISGVANGGNVVLPTSDGTLALTSDISPTSPAFSNAVLSVGLGIDTNTVAVINELVDSAHDLPVTGATSVGALLLALAAAVAALKKRLRYNLNVITIASSGAATATLADRSINEVTAASAVTSITFTFPPRQTGQARDFFIRLVIEGTTVPTLYFNEPNGGGAVAFDADDDSWADIESGVNILMFTDTAE